MFTILIPFLAGTPAFADAQVSFEADMPVRFYVDGQRVSSMANLSEVELALSEGEHTLRVDSMLGRTLYSEEFMLADGEVLQADWRFGRMEVSRENALAAVADAPVEEAPEEAPPEDLMILALPAYPEDEVAAVEESAPPEGVEVPLGASTTLHLAQGEVHLSITVGAPEGTRTVDISITEEGVHVFDGEDAFRIPLGDEAPPTAAPLATGRAVFVSRDGRWANLYIDGELAAYLTNEGQVELELPAGEHEVEIRDSRGRQLWHRGRLSVSSGAEIEVGFARDLAPSVQGDPDAWTREETLGLL